MTIRIIDTTIDHTNAASIQAHDHRNPNASAKVRRFSMHLLEMLVAMMAGMPVFFMLRSQIPASSIYAAAFVRGTSLYGLAMAVFMTVPMVAWMIVRGHGWQHSAEMAFAMFAPVVAVIGLSLLGVNVNQPWIGKASHLGMMLGMLIAMLYRRDHYTGTAGHSAHAAHREIS